MLPHPLAGTRLTLLPLTLKQYYQFICQLPQLEQELGLCYQGRPVEGAFRTALQQRYLKFLTARRQPFFHTLWLLTLPKERLILGNIAFKGSPDTQGTIEIGYGIGEAFRGQGYMTEAVQILTAAALSLPSVRAVTAVTAQDNTASIRVLQKSNFFYTGASNVYLYWMKSSI